jgi:hypothetical protein
MTARADFANYLTGYLSLSLGIGRSIALVSRMDGNVFIICMYKYVRYIYIYVFKYRWMDGWMDGWMGLQIGLSCIPLAPSFV